MQVQRSVCVWLAEHAGVVGDEDFADVHLPGPGLEDAVVGVCEGDGAAGEGESTCSASDDGGVGGVDYAWEAGTF